MSLVNFNQILPADGAADWAVGAFNVHNLEFIQAVVEAAEMEHAPVALAVAPLSIEFMGLNALGAACLEAARRSRTPVAVHLDHAESVGDVEAALELGFSSVMFDGSNLPLEENIADTRRVVEMAHQAGATAEGEIGIMSTAGRDGQSRFTEPDEARRMVEETGVDLLAVSIGSVHGMKAQGARLDLELLRQLRKSLKVPMVLHGSSGVVDEDMRSAIRAGIDKVNIGTHLFITFTESLKRSICLEKFNDPTDFLSLARRDVRDQVIGKIRLLGSENKAKVEECT